jgi:transposase-like protein
MKVMVTTRPDSPAPARRAGAGNHAERPLRRLALTTAVESKARLVITAVTVEKRTVSEVARTYGVARSWVYVLLARYRAEGDAAFNRAPTAPRASPRAIPDAAAGLIVRLRKELAGAPDCCRTLAMGDEGLTAATTLAEKAQSGRRLVAQRTYRIFRFNQPVRASGESDADDDVVSA